MWPVCERMGRRCAAALCEWCWGDSGGSERSLADWQHRTGWKDIWPPHFPPEKLDPECAEVSQDKSPALTRLPVKSTDGCSMQQSSTKSVLIETGSVYSVSIQCSHHQLHFFKIYCTFLNHEAKLTCLFFFWWRINNHVWGETVIFNHWFCSVVTKWTLIAVLRGAIYLQIAYNSSALVRSLD